MSTTAEDVSTLSTAAPAEGESSLVLCHFGPARIIPSLSVFVMKLETYLRMNGITYRQELSFKTSSKGKVPYIKDDGKEVTDTNFIIPYLNKKFGKDLNASLDEREKAISLSFMRMIEENLYWTLVHYRWIENWPAFSKLLPLTGMRKKLFGIAGPLWFKPGIKSNLFGHGMGRHSSEEIKIIAEKDLRGLSAFLGAKPFFMGNEPTEVDASLFGLTAQILYAAPGSYYEDLLMKDLKNLAEYTDRMREKYFPDWDQKLMQDQNPKEEKAVDDKKEAGVVEEDAEEDVADASKKEAEKATAQEVKDGSGAEVEEDVQQYEGNNKALVKEENDESAAQKAE